MAITQIRGNQIKDEDLTSDDLADASVRGATGNAGTQREIATGTVSTVDLRDDAVDASKLLETDDYSVNTLAITGSSLTQLTAGTLTVDSTNSRIGIGLTPTVPLDFVSAATGVLVKIRGSNSGHSETLNVLRGGSVGATLAYFGHDNKATGGLKIKYSDASTGDFELLSINSALILNSGDDIYTLNPGTLVVGSTTVTSAGAALEISGTTKAFLTSRMTTTQRNDITSPINGMIVYNTTTAALNLYTSSWGDISGPASNVLQVAGDPGGPAEGDIWYDTVTKQYKGRTDTTTVILG